MSGLWQARSLGSLTLWAVGLLGCTAGPGAGTDTGTPTYAEWVGTTCDDRVGEAIFQPAEGGPDEDWTSGIPGQLVLDRAGTLVLCEGTWTATLFVEADGVTIAGAGGAHTTLHPLDGLAIDVQTDVLDFGLRDLTVAGQGTPVNAGGGMVTLRNDVEAELDGVSLQGHTGTALFIAAGSKVVGRQLEVLNNDLRDHSMFGVVQIWQGAEVTLEEATFADNQGLALMIWYAQTTVHLSDCTFRDNQGEPAGAIALFNGPTLTVSHCDFEGNEPADFASDEVTSDLGADASFACSGGSCS